METFDSEIKEHWVQDIAGNLIFVEPKAEKYNYRQLLPDGYDNFIQRLYSELPIEGKRIKAQEKCLALNNYISNLMISYVDNVRVALSQSRGGFKSTNFYGLGHYSYRNMISITKALLDEDFVEKKQGWFNHTLNKGRVARIWPKEKFIDFLTPYFDPQSVSITREGIFSFEGEGPSIRKFQKIPYSRLLILKDRQKKLLRYSHNNQILKKQKFLVTYNDFIETQTITKPFNFSLCNSSFVSYFPTSPQLGTKLINSLYYIPLDCQLYRSYNNGNFSDGGRFYGADYQGLKKEERKLLLVNGNPVTEIDFSSLQLRMLYHLENIEYNSDPYSDINEEKALRPILKLVALIVLNSKNYKQAVLAVQAEVRQKESLQKLMIEHNLKIEDLIHSFEIKHSRISKYFYSGIGLRLQNRDSNIAEDILKCFTKRGVACLCIHDSFIVERKYRDELNGVMKDVYKKHIGHNCQTKIEY